MGGDFRKGVCFTREMDVELDREQSAVGGAHTPPRKSPPPCAWNLLACWLPQHGGGTAADAGSLLTGWT